MKPVLTMLGSLKITFPAMLALIAGVLVSYRLDAASRAWLVAPLAVLALNLLAAIATHPRFRRQTPLLAFHLCLLAALALALAGELTRFDGRVEVLTGQPFDARSVVADARGPLHPDGALEDIEFRQERFRVDYAPGLVRGETRSTVAVPDGRGGWSRHEVGDTRPLADAGARLYTTSNKGLAAVLTWVGVDGRAQTGAVHFPSWPLNDWKQVNDWRAPSGERLALELEPNLAVPVDRTWTFDSAALPARATLTVAHGPRRVRLEPGQSLVVAGARVRFEGVGTWMGYRVAYDPTLPWLLATGLAAAAALAWHFLVSPVPAPRRERRTGAVARAVPARPGVPVEL